MNTRLRPLTGLLIQSVRDDAVSDLGTALAAISAEDLVAATHMHRLTTAVARKVLPLGDLAPSWAAPLNAQRHAQLLRHLRAREDLKVAGGALDAAGINWVAVKGPVLSDVVWPAPDMREYHDLDLVVDRRRFADALQALDEVEFQLVDRNWPLLRSTMRAEVAMAGKYGTPVDLHWHIAVPKNLRLSFDIDIDGMLKRSTLGMLGNGLEVPVLDPVDTVFHLAFHAAQSGGGRLVWLGDIHHAVLAAGFSWESLGERAREARAEVPIALIVDRAHRTLGLVPQPTESVDRPARGGWGRLARRRDLTHPFPGLPGDPHLGGVLYTSARRGVPGSGWAAVASTLEARRIERRIRRRGQESRPLWIDVPDIGARSEYLRMVQTSDDP